MVVQPIAGAGKRRLKRASRTEEDKMKWPCLWLLFILLAFGTGFADEPAYVGGQNLAFGRVTLLAPDGWFRATPEMEKEYEAFAFIYVLKRDDPQTADAKCIVRLEKEIDDFETVRELASYYSNVEGRLTKSGWKKGSLPVNGSSLACYRITEGEMTTYLVQIPFGKSSISTYTVIPKSEAGFPKVALKLLEAFRLKEKAND